MSGVRSKLSKTSNSYSFKSLLIYIYIYIRFINKAWAAMIVFN